MTQPTLESFFSGGGGKSLSWKGVDIGTTYTGVIKQVHAPQQATDPATNLPATTRDGKPRVQVRIDLATSYRDPSDPDDDGSRGLYVGGWMTGAIGDAMRKAGVSGTPQVGATLSVRLIDRESNGPAVNPTNKFDAHYVPPNPADGFFGGAPAPNGAALAPLGAPAVAQAGAAAYPAASPIQAPVAPAPVAQPALAPLGAPAAQPVPTQASPTPMKPAAISDAAWATMDDSTKAAVAASLNPPF